MPLNAFQKREMAQYTQKINQLRTERDKASRELGQVNESLANGRRELSLIQEEKAKVKRELETLGHDILELKIIHDRYHAQNTGLASERGRLDQESKEKEKKHAENISSLKTELEGLEKKKASFSELDRYTGEKQEILRVTILRLQAVKDELALAEGSIEAFRIEHEEKKAELETLMKKNGIIMTENNNAFNTLRIYVKRLQKYYDERGLRVDLIGQFKL